MEEIRSISPHPMVSTDSVYGDYDRDEVSIDFPLKKFIKVVTPGVSNKEIEYTIN